MGGDRYERKHMGDLDEVNRRCRECAEGADDKMRVERAVRVWRAIVDVAR